jgi:hypothetical protein
MKMNKISIIVIAVIAIVAVSSLSMAVNIASASTNSSNIAIAANKVVERSWVKFNGYINQWGTTKVNGLIQTQARTALLASENTNQLASATAIWTTNNSRPINSVRAKENFTYTFYAARLNNASVSTLSKDTDNYFLNGTWNIYTVTSNTMVITNANNEIVKVNRNSQTSVTKAYGELNITDSSTKFTLAITGQDTLSGSVFRSTIRQVQFNPFKIVEDTSTKVTRADLAQMAPCIHAMPGWGSYDTKMDFNGNFKVDIADISTAAANM